MAEGNSVADDSLLFTPSQESRRELMDVKRGSQRQQSEADSRTNTIMYLRSDRHISISVLNSDSRSTIASSHTPS